MWACSLFDATKGTLVDPLAQIPVHQVALTSVESTPDRDGKTYLYAAVGIWCDLSSVPDEALPWAHDGHVPVATITDAYLLPDRARVALSLQADDLGPDEVRVAADDGLDLGPFTVVVPTVTVALTNALMLTPAVFHLVLIDGTPPARPEFTVLDHEEIAAAVEMDPNLTLAALQVVDPALRLPFEVTETGDGTGMPEDLSGGADVMRDSLWAAMAGLGLGQPWSLHRLGELAMLGAAFTRDGATGTDGDDRARSLALAASRVAETSYDAARQDDVVVNLSTFPPLMAPLVDRIRDEVDIECLMLLSDGVPFVRVASEHGWDKALPALAVVVAARAHAVTTVESDSGASVSWLVGAWLDDDFAEPTWAVRPLLSLLGHHDVAVAADLLGVGPAGAGTGEASNLLREVLHACTFALVESEMDAEELSAALGEHTVRPANFHDVVAVADALLTPALEVAMDPDDIDSCLGCVGTLAVLSSGWDLKRLARAVVALLPCLADVSAADQGLPVGDEAWVRHRNVVLGKVLDESARRAVRAFNA